MKDRIKQLLEQALLKPGEYISGEVSDILYLKFYCDSKFWGVNLASCENPSSRILFAVEISKGEVEMESLEVSPIVQRKGIGSLLFSGMLEIVRVMDEELTMQGHPKISIITGELRPYDPPYDQYEKSIPFYIKQADLHNLPVQFYEEDKATFKKQNISLVEALGFIDTWKCGGFKYSL